MTCPPSERHLFYNRFRGNVKGENDAVSGPGPSAPDRGSARRPSGGLCRGAYHAPGGRLIAAPTAPPRRGRQQKPRSSAAQRHPFRRGAHRAPAGLPPAAPILPGQARSPRGVCPPIQHTSGGSTNGGIGCRPPPAPDTGAMPKARVSRIGGPGWVWPGGPRRSRSHTGHTPPAALCLLCRQGQSRPPRRAESPRQIL